MLSRHWQLQTALNWIVVSTVVLTPVIDSLLKMRHPMDTMAGHAVANLLLSLAVLVLVHSVCVWNLHLALGGLVMVHSVCL